MSTDGSRHKAIMPTNGVAMIQTLPPHYLLFYSIRSSTIIPTFRSRSSPNMEILQDDADAAGDLVLLVGSGDDHLRIRASSKVLSLASPVFAALLSPRFAEGHSLTAEKGLAPQEISLPEDNPKAMAWICQVLHFRKRVTEDVSFLLIREIALLCDKYDISQALGPWSELWMQQLDSSVHVVNPYPHILWISYALNNHNAFWRDSRELMRLYTSEGLISAKVELANGLLPERILGICASFRDIVLRTDASYSQTPLIASARMLYCNCKRRSKR